MKVKPIYGQSKNECQIVSFQANIWISFKVSSEIVKSYTGTTNPTDLLIL